MAYTSVLHMDLETTSVADLRKVGAYRYAQHPSTRIACLAWRFDNERTLAISRPTRNGPGSSIPSRVAHHIAGGGKVAGWNIPFDATVWNAKFPSLPITIEMQDDVMARALYWGLPASLDLVGFALGMGTLKDKQGHALMMQMCKPRAWNPDGTPRWWDMEDDAKLQRLMAYCVRDVDTECEADARIPALPPAELEVWRLDQRVNQRGIAVDTNLVQRLQTLTDATLDKLNREMKALTQGAVSSVTNTKALQAYVDALGYPKGMTLKRKDVETRLRHPACQGDERAVLELRLDGARASTAKLRAMENARCDDGRVRGVIQYYGAGRTGRWAGRLVQPHNYPRGMVKGPKGVDMVGLLVRLILSSNSNSPYMLEEFTGVPAMGVVSSLLRGCLIPAPGHIFVVADLAQIEARVVAWLAGQTDILEVFARGEDVYVYTAGKIGSTDRQLGKVVVLACGFGMGPGKFQATAATYGLNLDAEFAEDTVRTWRGANPKIVQFWWDCDRAARTIAGPRAKVGDTITVGPVTFIRGRSAMLIELPSKRRLVYRNIRLTWNSDTERDEITYDGVNQYTRRWEALRTYGGKLVENITQAVARDVMRDAYLEAEKAGLRPVLTVHDELIGEVPKHTEHDAMFDLLTIMRRTPTWAPGLPVGAEGHTMERYRK